MRRFAALVVLAAAIVSLARTPASAVPIFAERYGFKCTQCHTAVPELNSFGEHFRRAGYRIPNVPEHHVVPIALRLQDVYNEHIPVSQTRRFNALAIALTTGNFGRDEQYSYFARYFFGSQGAAGSLYYGFLQNESKSPDRFVRLGLFGLPLIANATNRLDTITAPPVYTYTVVHNSANFSTPRLGLNLGHRTDTEDLELAISFDEYHGAAYGAPAPPSEFAQSFTRPELFGTANVWLSSGVQVGVMGLDGERTFTSRVTGNSYSDVYYRDGLEAQWVSPSHRWELTGQQLWGHDDNTDGFLTAQESSGGFVDLKYRPSRNAYVAARYDASANPFATRQMDFYAVWAPTIHARLVVEHVRPIGFGGQGQNTNVQLLFALPFEKSTAGGP